MLDCGTKAMCCVGIREKKKTIRRILQTSLHHAAKKEKRGMGKKERPKKRLKPKM